MRGRARVPPRLRAASTCVCVCACVCACCGGVRGVHGVQPCSSHVRRVLMRSLGRASRCAPLAAATGSPARCRTVTLPPPPRALRLRAPPTARLRVKPCAEPLLARRLDSLRPLSAPPLSSPLRSRRPERCSCRGGGARHAGAPGCRLPVGLLPRSAETVLGAVSDFSRAHPWRGGSGDVAQSTEHV